MNKKSILAETLADIQEIKEGIEKNANHVFKSLLKEDLESIVRKGLSDSEDEPQTDDIVGDLPTNLPGGETGSEEMADGGIEDLGIGDEMGADGIDLGVEPGIPGEPEVIDLTDKSDDEVIQHFNLMEPADEIEIIQTPENGIQINIKPASAEGGEEFETEPGAEGGDEFGGETEPTEEPTEDEPETEEPGDEPEEDGGETETSDDDDDDTETFAEGEDDKEPVYEIEIADEATTSMKKSEKHMKNVDEEEVVDEDVKHVKTKAHMKHASSQGKQYTEELQESLVKTRKKIQSLMTENSKKSTELSNMTTLAKNFKKQEAEYKLAIANLKEELSQVALYTSNLSYIVKLLSENTTTKDEKLSIIKRFDKAKSLNESSEIFNSVESLLNESKKKSTDKIIEEQVLKTPKASGSSNINETTVYKSSQEKNDVHLSRIKEIMGIKK